MASLHSRLCTFARADGRRLCLPAVAIPDSQPVRAAARIDRAGCGDAKKIQVRKPIRPVLNLGSVHAIAVLPLEATERCGATATLHGALAAPLLSVRISVCDRLRAPDADGCAGDLKPGL